MRKPYVAFPFMLCALAIAIGATHGATPANAEGPAVVTVAGSIAKTNRGPLDPFTDIFFVKTHELSFDRGFAFDREALAALGMHKLVARYPGTERTVEVEGPLLRDVVRAVGGSGTSLTVTALDGYAADIPVSDINDWPVVLALKSEGKWLGIGGRGPAWVVYPVSDYPALAGSDDARWVWGVFYIRIE